MSDLRILCVGKIVGADIDWHISPLPVEDEPVDGELQDVIDYGQELADYQDWIADQDYHRSGNW